MAARQDAERLRQLLQNDIDLVKVASDYLARLRMLATTVGSLRDNATALAPIAALLACQETGSDAVTVASAQKASFRRPGEFQNCLKAVRNLLVQKSASSSPQKTRLRPATISFESLVLSYRNLGVSKGTVQEMNRTMQEWERLLDKAKSGQHTGVDDPRYTKAIFVWVLNSLKYPIEKAAFCVQQNMRLVDLTNILQSLDSRCFARKAALEKKTELHYHGSSPDDQEPALTPTKSLKRKASTIDMADGIGSRPEEQDLSPTKRLTRSVTRPQITPTKPIAFTPDHARSAQSARSGRSSNPFRPSPTKARGRPVSPEHLPATPSDSEKDGDDGRYSPPPPPRYRLRPLFLETLGLSKKDNLREVEWFRNWRAQVIKRGFESESEDEIEEFDEDEENPDGGRNGITNSDQSEDGETYG